MATSGVDAVTLDPWHEPGIPLEQQYRSWKQRIKAPYDKHEVDAYTRTRVILMNGVEVGPEEDEHLGWAQTKLAELSLKAITQEPPPDPNGSAGSSSNPIWRSSRSMPPRSTSGGSPMGRSCPPRSRHQPRERRRRPARSVLLG